MAGPQSELFIPTQSATISSLDANRSTFFSEAYLSEAIARLKSQDIQRHGSIRPFAGSSRITVARPGTGQYHGRTRIQSPRKRAFNVQAMRSNSRLSYRSNSKGTKTTSVSKNDDAQLGEESKTDSRQTPFDQSKKAAAKTERTPVLSDGVSFGHKFIKFEALADWKEKSLLWRTDGSTDEVTDRMESASISDREMSKPSRLEIQNAEEVAQRPLSVVQTPITIYHDGPEVGTKDGEGALADIGTTQLVTSISETVPSSALVSAPETLSQAKAAHVTALPLRSGSVVTVIRPEQTAWQRSIYIQGPIKLPSPNVIARRGSVASMYAFQDAIERDGDQSSAFSRNPAEEEILDDTVDFFESLGFRPDFQELDLSSIRYEEPFTPEPELEDGAKQERLGTAALPAIEESMQRVPSNGSSSVNSINSVSSVPEDPLPPHLDAVDRRTYSARDAAKTGNPGSPKRFNSLSKKRKYKRTALNRLTSII
ncbi:MAG: hypothetical protein M1822_000232 [Bathelium mastoideum]|nr:MAG: hypothetical protein M1822_000232 [Bathelium mastoideum]